MIHGIRWLDETEKLGIEIWARRSRYRQKKATESSDRNIPRIIIHCHWAAATIDDRRIENAPKLNSQRITLRITILDAT